MFLTCEILQPWVCEGCLEDGLGSCRLCLAYGTACERCQKKKIGCNHSPMWYDSSGRLVPCKHPDQSRRLAYDYKQICDAAIAAGRPRPPYIAPYTNIIAVVWRNHRLFPWHTLYPDAYEFYNKAVRGPSKFRRSAMFKRTLPQASISNVDHDDVPGDHVETVVKRPQEQVFKASSVAEDRPSASSRRPRKNAANPKGRLASTAKISSRSRPRTRASRVESTASSSSNSELEVPDQEDFNELGGDFRNPLPSGSKVSSSHGDSHWSGLFT